MKYKVVSESPNITWLKSEIMEDRIDPGFYTSKNVKTEEIIKSNSFKILNDISTDIRDHSFLNVRTQDYVSCGYPFIRAKNLKDVLLNTSDMVFINNEIHHVEKDTHYIPGDLLAAKTGNVCVSVVPETIEECNTSQDVMGIRLKSGEDAYYLSTFFNTSYGISIQERYQTGSVHPHLALENLRKLYLCYPNKRIQKYIGDKVRKAEQLREECIKLIKLAKSEVLKVINSINRTPKKLSGYKNVLEKPTVAYVFPQEMAERIDADFYKNEFQENEAVLDKLPTKRIKYIMQRGDYGTLPSGDSYINEGLIFIRGTDIYQLSISFDDVVKVPEKYFNERVEAVYGDILLLIKGASIDHECSVAIMPKINEKAIFNGSLYRLRVKDEYDPHYIAIFMTTDIFLLQKRRAITNTGIYYNDKDTIENFRVLMPATETQKSIGTIVRKAENLRIESKTLIKEAKQDVEDLIEGKFDMSKLRKNGD